VEAIITVKYRLKSYLELKETHENFINQNVGILVNHINDSAVS